MNGIGYSILVNQLRSLSYKLQLEPIHSYIETPSSTVHVPRALISPRDFSATDHSAVGFVIHRYPFPHLPPQVESEAEYLYHQLHPGLESASFPASY